MKPDHISVDDMERYHLGQVQEPESAVLEEHLLWCHRCLDQMEATERFVDRVRGGIVSGGFDLELEP
jgi:anti-sigma factor RsiW